MYSEYLQFEMNTSIIFFFFFCSNLLCQIWPCMKWIFLCWWKTYWRTLFCLSTDRSLWRWSTICPCCSLNIFYNTWICNLTYSSAVWPCVCVFDDLNAAVDGGVNCAGKKPRVGVSGCCGFGPVGYGCLCWLSERPQQSGWIWETGEGRLNMWKLFSSVNVIKCLDHSTLLFNGLG